MQRKQMSPFFYFRKYDLSDTLNIIGDSPVKQAEKFQYLGTNTDDKLS